MKDVICSFASGGRENYNGMLLRLIDSVKEHWAGDMLVYSPDHWFKEYKGVKINKGWPKPAGIQSLTHSEMPYQFKTALIQEALEMGYERIIWLDSSMQLKKDLTPLFDGVNGLTFFENLGHPTWKYLSDEAFHMLNRDGYFGPDYEFSDLQMVKQVWGGAFALNFAEKFNLAYSFFNELKEYSLNGSFKDGSSRTPGFVTHRHDQAVMSVLLNDKAHTLLPYGQILCPPHDRTGEYGNDPYLVCRGL
jgi:hypothetical protein